MTVLLILFVLGVILIILGASLNDGGPVIFLGVVLEIILVVLLIIVAISQTDSSRTVSNLENFYARNQKIYAEAVVVFPDAAKTQTSDATTTTTKLSWDYTQDVMWYNRELQWYRNYQNNWFLGVFIATVPDSLKFIELKAK